MTNTAHLTELGHSPDALAQRQADLLALLPRLTAPWLAGLGPCTVLRSTAYTFRARVADRWRRGRVLLLGDAAHPMVPTLGQGATSAIEDAVAAALEARPAA